MKLQNKKILQFWNKKYYKIVIISVFYLSSLYLMTISYLQLSFWVFFNTFLCFNIFAQTNISLQEALQYAKEHNEDLRSYQTEAQLIENNIAQTKSKNRPQINGVVDVRDNLKLQTSILPFNPDPSPTAVQGATPVQFGTQYNATAGIELNWAVYDPNYRQNIRSQNINTKINANSTKTKENELLWEVKKNYYAALLEKEKIKLYQKNVVRTAKFYEDAKTLYNNQQIQEVEVLKVQLEHENQKTELEKAQQSYEKSLIALKYTLNLPLNESIVLSDSLLLKEYNQSLSNNAITTWQAENQLNYQSLSLQIEQEQMNQKRIKSTFLPTVNLYGYVGTQAFRQEFNILNTNEPWFGLAYVGVRVNVPIFDGFLKKNQIQQSRISIEKKQIEQQKFVKKYDYECTQAIIAQENAWKNLNIQRNNLQLAEAIFQNINTRYKTGLALAKELTDAELKLTDAQTQYLARLYEYVVAKLDLEKLLYF
ncbi:MAG: TolC family protein [Cytophagales bacterium]|nr:MAG: TolC family protein [Cytophagales bacterium]